tara:strand:- start:44 stop:232 length:189 start_codon:yes stop_codon:yes gene_type:complete
MVNELCLVKKLTSLSQQLPMFYPFGFDGGEIVLCLRDSAGFAKVLYCGELFTIQREYLAVWV